MVQCRIRNFLQFEVQITILRRHLLRIIPLQIRRSTVPDIYCFPERVVSREKSATFRVELVGKHELVVRSIEACPRLDVLRSILVDQLWEVWSAGEERRWLVVAAKLRLAS